MHPSPCSCLPSPPCVSYRRQNVDEAAATGFSSGTDAAERKTNKTDLCVWQNQSRHIVAEQTHSGTLQSGTLGHSVLMTAWFSVFSFKLYIVAGKQVVSGVYIENVCMWVLCRERESVTSEMQRDTWTGDPASALWPCLLIKCQTYFSTPEKNAHILGLTLPEGTTTVSWQGCH